MRNIIRIFLLVSIIKSIYSLYFNISPEHFKVLNITEYSLDVDEIKKGFRLAKIKYHPDK